MGVIHILVIFATVSLSLVQAQCDGMSKTTTEDKVEIKSPNFDTGGEYGKSANCSWEFNPPANVKEYTLVLTVTKLKLYVLKNRRKHCLESYNLAINQNHTKCDRYVTGPTNGTEATEANYFCNTYYSSPTCASIAQNQGCESNQQTEFPVPVTFISNGTRDPNATTTPMYFEIQYKFIDCEAEPSTPSPSTPRMTSPTVTTALSSTSGKDLTTQTTPTITADNNTIIIAASAGGGGLILILAIILIICICKRREKTAESTQEIPLQHQKGGTKETKNDQLAPVEGNSNPAYQSGTAEYETVDKAGQSGANDPKIEAVEYASTGGVTHTNQSGAEIYTTVDLAPQNNQSGGGMYDTLGVVPEHTHPDSELYDKLGGATATGQSGAVTYDKLSGVGLPDQSGVEMYSTVGEAPETGQSGGDTYDRLGGAIQTDKSEPEMYATVDTPQSVNQSSQPPSGHVAISDQPESAMYAAVSVKKKGVKETIHYNKESVDNVLYGTADDAK